MFLTSLNIYTDTVDTTLLDKQKHFRCPYYCINV